MRARRIFELIFYVAALLFFVRDYYVVNQEKDRLDRNQAALLEDVQQYKTRDSLNVASIKQLKLTASEFKQTNLELLGRVEELGLKVRRLQSVTSTGTTTTTKIKTEIQEKLVYIDKEKSRQDTLKCLEYISPYIELSGCTQNGIFEGVVISRDTIDQIIHRVPRRFLFIKYGTKGIKQEIYSRNPNSYIHYVKYIDFK